MAKKFRILFHGILLILGVFSGCFCMVVMVQGFSANNAQEIKTGISFPYRVPGTDLVVLALVATDGDVCQENLDVPKFNLASLLVRNNGSNWVSYCNITLRSGEQEWVFEATMLPPESETLLLETSRQLYPDAPIIICAGEAELFTPDPVDVVFQKEDMQSFFVLNAGNEEIQQLKIYYKTYYEEWDLYGEGKAHECIVTNLQPGENRQIFPKYYAGDYSRILFAVIP